MTSAKHIAPEDHGRPSPWTRRLSPGRFAPIGFLSLAALLACSTPPTKEHEKEKPLYAGRTLEQWLCGQHSGDDATEAEAKAALRKIGRESPDVVRDILRALKEEDKDGRAAAASLLGTIGLEDKSVFPHLIETLSDESRYVRGNAEESIWQIAPATANDTPKLIRDLGDAEKNIRLYAAFALGKARGRSDGLTLGLTEEKKEIDEAVRPLLRTLQDDDWVVRLYAAKSLAAIGEMPKDAEHDVIVAIADRHPSVRSEALNALAKSGWGNSVIIPLLAAAFEDPSEIVREYAARAVGPLLLIKTDCVDMLVHPLIRALGDSSADVREAAAGALSYIGPRARAAVPALIAALGDANEEVRQETAEALGDIASARHQEDVGESDRLTLPEMERVVFALTRLLKDDVSCVRNIAACALSEIGPPALSAVPALIELLRQEPNESPYAVVSALGEIGPGAAAAIPFLVTRIKGPDASFRRRVIETLDSISDRQEEVLTALATALADEDKEVADAAASTLARRGGASIDVLSRALRSEEPRVRYRAAWTLGCIVQKRRSRTGGFSDLPEGEDEFDDRPKEKNTVTDEETRVVVSALAVALRDENVDVRKYACKALEGASAAATPALLALAEALHDKDSDLRQLAAVALGGLGPAAEPAIPDLVAVLKDEYAPVRRQAIQALVQIAPRSAATIPPLLEALGDGMCGEEAANALAAKGLAAVPALRETLRSGNTIARAWAAYALGRSGSAAVTAVPDLLNALDETSPFFARDLFIQEYVANAIAELLPDAALPVPLLARMLTEGPRKAAAEALRRYGAAARPAVPALADCLRGGSDPNVLNALAYIGADKEAAKILAELDLSDAPKDRLLVFQALLPLPGEALAYLKKNPAILEDADETAIPLIDYLKSRVPESAELRQAVLDSERLTIRFMACIGDPQLLPRIKARIAAANSYEHVGLQAYARALGEPSDRVVRISKTQRGDFRPASAWPGIDRRRTPAGKGGGHGDGDVQVLITGTLRMPDGTPAVNPRFFNLNDRFLLGTAVQSRAPVTYDPKTGRFLFFTELFAAFTNGGEPGPFQTGSALVRIEADGVEPLRVRFFDEMPEVEITLSPAVR